MGNFLENGMRKKGSRQVTEALKAYEDSVGDKCSTIGKMMDATGWSRALAEFYYDGFRLDGIGYWREKTGEWDGRTAGSPP